jgi:HK97 gp10 family phage protein
MPVSRTSIDIHIKTTKRRGLGAQDIDSIIKNVRSNSAMAAYNFARNVEAGAKRRVHVITGHLKGSIHRVRIRTGVHRVIVGAHYGVYEEYGTRYRPPHPYFRPAVREAKRQFERDMKKVFHR